VCPYENEVSSFKIHTDNATLQDRNINCDIKCEFSLITGHVNSVTPVVPQFKVKYCFTFTDTRQALSCTTMSHASLHLPELGHPAFHPE
jgi:hypothetical protein